MCCHLHSYARRVLLCSLVRGLAMLLSVTAVVAFPCNPQLEVFQGQGHHLLWDVFTSTRLDFLIQAFSWTLTPHIVTDKLCVYQGSSHRQCESCWKTFQCFLAWQPRTCRTVQRILFFSSFLICSMKRVLSHPLYICMSLKDPLFLGFQHTLNSHLVDLI